MWLKSMHNEDQEALGYKTLWRKNALTSFRENKALGHSMHVRQPLK